MYISGEVIQFTHSMVMLTWNMLLVIYEIMVLVETDESKQSCQPDMWYGIVFACIGHIISAADIVYTIWKNLHLDRNHRINISHTKNFISCLIAIWPFIDTSNISHECYNNLVIEYPSLWLVALVESISFVYYLLLAVILMTTIIGMNYLIQQNKQKRTVPNGKPPVPNISSIVVV